MATAVAPIGVGARIKAVFLNKLVTAIQELQDGAARSYYELTRTAVTVTTATVASFGAWTTSGVYLSSGNGIAVPTDGLYIVGLQWLNTSSSWTTRSFLQVSINASIAQYWSADPGTGETMISGCALFRLNAGDVIEPSRYQNSGGTVTTNITMRIARVAI